MSASGKATIINQAVSGNVHSTNFSLQDANSANFIMVSVGATIVATAQVYVSNDPAADITVTTDWLPLGSPVALTGGGGVQELTDLNTSAPYLRSKVFIAYTSGTITSLKVFAVKKGTALR